MAEIIIAMIPAPESFCAGIGNLFAIGSIGSEPCREFPETWGRDDVRRCRIIARMRPGEDEG